MKLSILTQNFLLENSYGNKEHKPIASYYIIEMAVVNNKITIILLFLGIT